MAAPREASGAGSLEGTAAEGASGTKLPQKRPRSDADSPVRASAPKRARLGDDASDTTEAAPALYLAISALDANTEVEAAPGAAAAQETDAALPAPATLLAADDEIHQQEVAAVVSLSGAAAAPAASCSPRPDSRLVTRGRIAGEDNGDDDNAALADAATAGKSTTKTSISAFVYMPPGRGGAAVTAATHSTGKMSAAGRLLTQETPASVTAGEAAADTSHAAAAQANDEVPSAVASLLAADGGIRVDAASDPSVPPAVGMRAGFQLRTSLAAGNGTSTSTAVQLVEMPLPLAADSAATPALPPAWRVLQGAQTLTEMHDAATAAASSAMRDIAADVSDMVATFGSPAVAAVLQRPLPYRAEVEGPTSMLEFLHSADGGGVGRPLYERVNDLLSERSIVLLTGVSGAGKTKVAYDIGRRHALVVVAKVASTRDAPTSAWLLCQDVLSKLQAQDQRRRIASPRATDDRRSAVAVLLLLLCCHLEWALLVREAATAACTATSAAADVAAVCEATLRCQTIPACDTGVHALFAARLRQFMEFSADGGAQLREATVVGHLHALRHRVPSMRVVFCIDEVQYLLTNRPFDGFFEGTFDAPRSASAPAAAAGGACTAAASAMDAVAASSSGAAGEPSAVDASAYEGSTGWFYGMLVAVRTMIIECPWSVLLCGTSLRLSHELLLQHSPAKGVSKSVDADTTLGCSKLRAWFESYLTTAAAAGLDDDLIRQLAGRPLFGATFFSCLVTGLRGRAWTSADSPAALVRASLEAAIAEASAAARARVEALWKGTYASVAGDSPHLLVVWLYYLQRMGWGRADLSKRVGTSEAVMTAVQRGILHVRLDADCINLADEPITAAAILSVGDKRTESSSADVFRAIARHTSGAFSEASASKGAAVEDVVAWLLLRRGLNRTLTLRELLEPLLVPRASDELKPTWAVHWPGDHPPVKGEELFPEELLDYTVHLTGGLHCKLALGSTAAERTDLELFEREDGPGLLLHHTQTSAGGPDLSFCARRPAAPAAAAATAAGGDVASATAGTGSSYRLVHLQIKNAVSATALQMLQSVDMGLWYTDLHQRGTTTERASHAALRRVLTSHPEWADPVRVLCSARPWSHDSIVTAAWVSVGVVPSQPVLLLRYTLDNAGVDVGQSAATAFVRPPQSAAAWWPTRVRHWPAGTPHPQARMLPELPTDAFPQRPTCLVRFRAVNSGAFNDLQHAATAAGGHTVIDSSSTSLDVEYTSLASAMRAVANAIAGVALAGECGVLMNAQFIEVPR